MDVLSDLIQLLRLRGHLYGHLSLGAPFALSFPREVGHFFIVTDGHCRLQVDGRAPIRMETGDFAFLPSDEAFSLMSHDPARCLPPRAFTEDEGRSYSEDGRIVVDGDFENGVRLVSGCFRFMPQEARLLTDLMDGPLTYRATGGAGTPFMAAVFQMIADEARSGRIGAFTVMDRLAEVLLIQALRTRLEQPDANRMGWLGALRDPRLAKALGAIHFNPQKEWSVTRLARIAGMSRSAFSQKFKEEVGSAPIEHLTKWRIYRAGFMLAGEPTLPVSEVAPAIGYRSEGAFRRKFIEVMGMAPAKYRQLRRETSS